jgi:hypothetical protein
MELRNPDEIRHAAAALASGSVDALDRLTWTGVFCAPQPRVAARAAVLATAYAAHPERFSAGLPAPAAMPTAVWINPPKTLARSPGSSNTERSPLAHEAAFA